MRDEIRAVITANNAAKEQCATFEHDFPGTRAWMMDSGNGPQIQADNGKPGTGILAIFFQGPAAEFDRFANAFADGWDARKSCGS